MNLTATALALPGHPVAGPTWIRPLDSAFEDDLLQAVAGADDLRASVDRAVTIFRRDYAIHGVQWWAPAPDGASFRLELSSGNAAGSAVAASIGAAGTIVLTGGSASRMERAVGRLRPVLHHWWIAERLAEQVSELARRNES